MIKVNVASFCQKMRTPAKSDASVLQEGARTVCSVDDLHQRVDQRRDVLSYLICSKLDGHLTSSPGGVVAHGDISWLKVCNDHWHQLCNAGLNNGWASL